MFSGIIIIQQMSALQVLGISGFRSYASDSLQKIEFQTPLTLIWGKNGSGKTTIIEVLKYITTGALPPSCDKGKNFLMDPRLMGLSQMEGHVRLRFRAFNGRPVLAKRQTIMTISNKGSKLQSVEQTLKTKDQHGEMFEINHHCAEIEKQIPQLLGISKAVLENIVFCHQDESLWPFSDNTNLKTIFDEMFQTKRYTKIVDSFWDQHKEYIKEIKQSKKSLEYLKRLYDEDNRKKRQALGQMEKVSFQAEEVAVMRDAIEKLGLSPNATKEASDRKYQLVMKRGSIEERIKNGNRNIAELKNRIKNINHEYQAILAADIRIEKVNAECLNEIDKRMEELNMRKEGLQQQLEQTQNATAFTQKQMEVLGEIKRAKHCIPELKNENSEQAIVKLLFGRCEMMQKQRNELIKLKKQYDQIVLPTLLDLPLTQSAFHQQKRVIASETLKLEQAKIQLLRWFNFLFKSVSPRRPQNYDSSIQQRLQEIRMKLKLKREELVNYESAPITESFQQMKMQLQYAGIDFQKEVINYCTEKKKCVVCSRSLSDVDLQNIKNKCHRSFQKTKRRIEELQERSARNGEQEKVDPQQIIPILRKEISKAEELEGKLVISYEEHSKYKQQVDQAKLNDKLIACLRKAGLERDPQAISNNPINIPTPEGFVERINQYENMRLRLEPKMKEITLYQERVRRNRELEQQRQSASEQAALLRQRIAMCEQQTQGYELISNIHRRLSSLIKSRGSRRPNKHSDNETSSPEELQNLLSALSQQLKGLALEKEYCSAVMRMNQLEEEGRKLVEEFRQVDRVLRGVQEELQAVQVRAAEQAKLNVEYVARMRELDLKADLAFQEYHRPVEKQYLTKVLQLSSKEATASDLQTVCKTMQATISSFHRDKMDQVNKYLAEIWREVYHGDDITLIEILASFEEDSKKRKSYSYTIMMEKAGGKKMQMKGRCSMGQKVLASIVIRLALAQVFSNSARILALDEPTTNLDREHITNLAHQLGRLVELNEGKYLQMIIISHDLEFIRMMEKYTNCYYEVARDPRKFSIITRKEIREIYDQH